MEEKKPLIAVFCVGNRLHLDDGLGPAVYDEVVAHYDVPDNVQLFDLGVLTMDMINYVEKCDAIITVDAMDNTGEEPGTVLRGTPADLAHTQGNALSLHDLRLMDLLDAAALLGYETHGVCMGIQVQDADPTYLTDDLTPPVRAAIPLLVETLLAELDSLGAPLQKKAE